jgi:hypothetical protein
MSIELYLLCELYLDYPDIKMEPRTTAGRVFCYRRPCYYCLFRCAFTILILKWKVFTSSKVKAFLYSWRRISTCRVIISRNMVMVPFQSSASSVGTSPASSDGACFVKGGFSFSPLCQRGVGGNFSMYSKIFSQTASKFVYISSLVYLNTCLSYCSNISVLV